MSSPPATPPLPSPAPTEAVYQVAIWEHRYVRAASEEAAAERVVEAVLEQPHFQTIVRPASQAHLANAGPCYVHGFGARLFRQAMEQPIGTNNPQVLAMQELLITEEFREFLDAAAISEPPEILKELADLVFVCFQYAAARGWNLDEALDRVLASNLSKLGPDGKPIRRADGKVLKGPNYQPPDLSDLTAPL